MGHPRFGLERSHDVPAPRRTAALSVFVLALTLLATTPAPPVRAATGSIVVDASVDHAEYSTGEVDALTASVAWRTPRWSLSLTVPYLSKNAPVLLRLGDVAVPTPGAGPGPGGPPEDHGPGDGPGDGGGAGPGPDEDPGGGGGGQQGPNDDPGGGGGGGEGGGGNGGQGGNGDGGQGDGGQGGDGGPGNGSGGSSIAGRQTSQTNGQTGVGASADESGLGDPVLRLTLALPGTLPGGGRWGLFAATKAPVADDALGTGEWDAGAGAIFWRTGLLTDTYLEVGTWTLGDPDDVELDQVLTWEAYLTRRLPNGRWAFAALTRGATEAFEGAGSTAEVGAWAGYVPGGGRSALAQSVGLTATAGLGDAAPDWRAVLSWRLGFQGPRLVLGTDDDH